METTLLTRGRFIARVLFARSSGSYPWPPAQCLNVSLTARRIPGLAAENQFATSATLAQVNEEILKYLDQILIDPLSS